MLEQDQLTKLDALPCLLASTILCPLSHTLLSVTLMGAGVASPTSRPLPLRPPLPEGCFILFHLAELWIFLRSQLWQDVFSQYRMAMAPAGLDSGLTYLGSKDYFRKEMVFL